MADRKSPAAVVVSIHRKMGNVQARERRSDPRVAGAAFPGPFRVVTQFLQEVPECVEHLEWSIMSICITGIPDGAVIGLDVCRDAVKVKGFLRTIRGAKRIGGSYYCHEGLYRKGRGLSKKIGVGFRKLAQRSPVVLTSIGGQSEDAAVAHGRAFLAVLLVRECSQVQVFYPFGVERHEPLDFTRKHW